MGQKTTFLAVGLIIFAVILIILFVVSRVIGGPDGREPISDIVEETQIEDLVPVNKIVSTPIVYQGYTLSVENQISGWTTNRSFFFSAGESGLFGGGSRGILLAIADEPFQLPQETTDDRLGLGENTNVIVKGRIEILNNEQLQSALGVDLEDPAVTLNNQIISKWGLGPVLLIEDIQINQNN
jgi:hypothetical protein